MALSIRDRRVERLVNEVAALARESRTAAVRKALEARKKRLGLRVIPRQPYADLVRFLEREIWPTVPAHARGKKLSKADEEELLGYGPDGV